MTIIDANGGIPFSPSRPSGTKRVCAVIPVYNNASTVRSVAENTLRHLPDLLILDDGSTDADLKSLLTDLPLAYFRLDSNRGKGAALRKALHLLSGSGFEYMLTLDADGQHDPSDIPGFLALAETSDRIFAVGCRDFSGLPVPGGSKFGRRISNLLLKWECGIPLSDTQSGFRMYPVRLLADFPFRCSRFDFETEVLACAVLAGADFCEIPVKVYYPPLSERITHFRPLPDLTRLARLHFRLLLQRFSGNKNGKGTSVGVPRIDG